MSPNDTVTYALNQIAGFQMYGAYTEFKGYLIDKDMSTLKVDTIATRTGSK